MKDDIVHRILSILNNVFFINIDNMDDVENEPLLGPKAAMNAFELYELLMCLENEYGICFFLGDLMNGEFTTVSKIANAIRKKV